MESFVYDIWVPADSFFASPFFVSVLIFAWIPCAVIPHASSPNKQISEQDSTEIAACLDWWELTAGVVHGEE